MNFYKTFTNCSVFKSSHKLALVRLSDALITRAAQPHRLHEAFFGYRRKVLAAVAAKDQPTIPTVMFPSPQPELDLTALAAGDGVIGNPEDGKRRISIIDSFPRAIWVFRVAINHRMLRKRGKFARHETGNQIKFFSPFHPTDCWRRFYLCPWHCIDMNCSSAVLISWSEAHVEALPL